MYGFSFTRGVVGILLQQQLQLLQNSPEERVSRRWIELGLYIFGRRILEGDDDIYIIL